MMEEGGIRNKKDKRSRKRQVLLTLLLLMAFSLFPGAGTAFAEETYALYFDMDIHVYPDPGHGHAKPGGGGNGFNHPDLEEMWRELPITITDSKGRSFSAETSFTPGADSLVRYGGRYPLGEELTVTVDSEKLRDPYCLTDLSESGHSCGRVYLEPYTKFKLLYKTNQDMYDPGISRVKPTMRVLISIGYMDVKFDLQGGMIGGSGDSIIRHVKKDNSVDFPQDPKKEGLTFDGWYTQFPETYEGNPQPNAGKKVYWTKDSRFSDYSCDWKIWNDKLIDPKYDDIFVLRAKWNAEVTFDSEGGSPVQSQLVAEGERADRPEAPKKDGFIFLGWETEKGEPYDFTAPVTGHMKLKAKWSRIETGKFPLWFDLDLYNRGTGHTHYGNFTGVPEIEEMWKRLPISVTDSKGHTVEVPQVLQGVKRDGGRYSEGEELTITVDPAGVPEGHHLSYTTIFGEDYVIKKGYETFKIRYTKETNGSMCVRIPIGSMDVQFDLQGGTIGGSGDPIIRHVKKDNFVDFPQDPKKEHWTFGAWYTQVPETYKGQPVRNGGKRTYWTKEDRFSDYNRDWMLWNETDYDPMYDSVFRLRAEWKAKVTFDSNGGSPVQPQLVAEGRQVGRPEDPRRDGFTFFGWETEKGEPYDFTTPMRGRMTLRAKWKPDPQNPQNPQNPQDPQDPQNPQDPQKPQDSREAQRIQIRAHWNDAGYKDKRPSKVAFRLIPSLPDGTIVDRLIQTVTAEAASGWYWEGKVPVYASASDAARARRSMYRSMAAEAAGDFGFAGEWTGGGEELRKSSDSNAAERGFPYEEGILLDSGVTNDLEESAGERVPLRMNPTSDAEGIPVRSVFSGGQNSSGRRISLCWQVEAGSVPDYSIEMTKNGAEDGDHIWAFTYSFRRPGDSGSHGSHGDEEGTGSGSSGRSSGGGNGRVIGASAERSPSEQAGPGVEMSRPRAEVLPQPETEIEGNPAAPSQPTPGGTLPKTGEAGQPLRLLLLPILLLGAWGTLRMGER